MENYSTLEVRYDQSGDPYSVFEPGKEPPEPVPSTYSGPTPVNGVAPSNISQNQLEKRRIWGMRPRLFYLVVVVIILILAGAIAGGVAGGLASQPHDQDADSQNGDSTSSNTTDTGQNRIFVNSSLAASSLVDGGGNIIRSVFFQDSYGAIILRQWNSQTPTWKTRNLTSSLIIDTSRSDIRTYLGTPLAAASLEYEAGYNFETWVWFFTPDNGIQLVGSTDSTFTEMKISTDNLPLSVYPASESRLAIAWQGCSSDCHGDWLLAYQNENGQIGIANASSTWHLQTTLDGANSMGTYMAMVSQQYGGGLTNLSLLVEDSSPGSASNIQSYSISGGGEWQTNGQISNGLSPDPSISQLVGATLSNYTQQYFLTLLANGTVNGFILSGTEVVDTYESISFASGPSINFSSIATTLDATFYGISNDTILEYQIDSSDPSVFNYVGVVYP